MHLVAKGFFIGFATLCAASMPSIVMTQRVFAQAGAQGSSQQAGADAKIWSGVFTTAQATRGKTVYENNCSRCHAVALTGGTRGNAAPPLKGDRFWTDFERSTVGNLLSLMQRTMPQDAPASLRPEDYADILAYVLDQNGFPAGVAELSASEGLAAIPIVMKPGTVREVANFSRVRVVGCLAAGENNTWRLTRSTAPAGTSVERPTPADVSEAATAELGSRAFRLIDVSHLNPGAHIGHRMEVRGLLNNDPSDPRIDALWFAMVSPGCGG
jgi:mono/diheme cytochrome c family protein